MNNQNKKIERLELKVEKLQQEIDSQLKKLRLVNKRNSDLREAFKGISKLNNSKLNERAFYAHVTKLANAADYFDNLNVGQKEHKHTQLYEHFKDILKTWNYQKYEDFAKSYSHICHLSYYKGFIKMMYTLMEDYIKVYEWAMSIPNDRVNMVDMEGNYVSIGKGCCWWYTLNDDNITKMAKYVTGRSIIPNPGVWEKVKEIMIDHELKDSTK